LTDPEGWKNWFRQCAHEKMAAQLAAPTKQRRTATAAPIVPVTAPMQPVTSPSTPIPATLGHTDAMARLTETAMIPAITLLRPAIQVRDMRKLISEAVIRFFVEQHGVLPQEAWIAPLRFLSLGCREYFALDEGCARIGAYSVVVRANEMAEEGSEQEHIWLWHDSLFGGVEIVEDYYL
jgi:hypothetical protein